MIFFSDSGVSLGLLFLKCGYFNLSYYMDKILISIYLKFNPSLILLIQV